MRVIVFEAYGVNNTIYAECRKGDLLPWHDHKHERVTHGHFVLRGATLLEVEGQEPQVRTPDDPNIELAWDVKHQITALHDGTAFLNAKPAIAPVDPAAHGGVMLRQSVK